MTPPESATIIASLFAVEAREKKLARRVVWLQIATTLALTGIAFGFHGLPTAIAVLSGGLVAVANGVLLAWRMSRAALLLASEANHPSGAHRQLRLLYFYAAERFLVVVVLLGLCLVVMKLTPLAVLGGFVMGQAALIIARLILIRLN
ncbi:MAG: ATP synthase subunit I [Gallionella sp.]|nr:ATP synthase subunit I [Gallionella sp.]